jgi:alkanesulfonate monooxygenase SsuD/methylene tetrahydromethanopterin reductase-like flavin-dependent oxidoreductase (luciferase family)
VKLAVGLPTFLGNPIDTAAVLDWARLADSAGFEAVAAHDKPNHHTWDPLATLAAVATITSRVRLATTILILPPRQEALVGKQAAVIDQVSGGRLDLGVAPGIRRDDYAALGVPFEHRGARFDRQLDALLAQWDGGSVGPASVQDPRPPLWLGGYTEAALRRAARIGDGYLFGASGIAAMTRRVPEIRAAAAAAGHDGMPIAGLAYFALTSYPDAAADSERNLLAYYGGLHRPFDELVHCGDADTIAEAVDRYREAGLDRLYLFPTIPALEQLEGLAAGVLPRFAQPAVTASR